MSTRPLLDDLQTAYSKLVIYDDRNAMLPIGIDAEIRIDAEKPVKEWKFFNTKERTEIPPLALSELMKTTRQDLAEIWHSIKERADKTPFDNLSAGGFDLSNVPTEPTSEQKAEDNEAWNEVKKQEEAKNSRVNPNVKRLTPEAIERADEYTKQNNPELWEKTHESNQKAIEELKSQNSAEPKKAEKWSKPAPRKQAPQTKAIVVPDDIRSKQISALTKEDIKSYICPTATDPEAYMFLQLCQARKLNPFLNEAYLIKYGGKATMVVGKEAYMRKAEAHPQFDGFEAGIIIKNESGTLERREGTFIMKGECLVGGWAKIYRKDRKQPFISEVSIDEYNTKQSLWISKPATMIRKVAIVQGKREAFPSEFGGMYDAAEMGGEVIEAVYEEVEA